MLNEAKLALGRRLGSQQPKHEAHQNIRGTLILFFSALVLKQAEYTQLLKHVSNENNCVINISSQFFRLFLLIQINSAQDPLAIATAI